MDYAHYKRIADAASETVRNGDDYVALAVGYDAGRFHFTIWAAAVGGGLNSEKLDAEQTSQERLEAHLRGFVANHRQAWLNADQAAASDAAATQAPRA